MQTYKVTVDDQGHTVWRQNGLLHRLDGPAVINADGTQMWYQNDKLHREDGPAIVYTNGDCYWYQNDELHREDGPAHTPAGGEEEFWLNDVHYSKEEFDALAQQRKSPCIGKVVEIDGVKYKLSAV